MPPLNSLIQFAATSQAQTRSLPDALARLGGLLVFRGAIRSPRAMLGTGALKNAVHARARQVRYPRDLCDGLSSPVHVKDSGLLVVAYFPSPPLL